jgi:hypothetical protein
MRRILFAVLLFTTVPGSCFAQVPTTAEPFNASSYQGVSEQDRTRVLQILRGFKLIPQTADVSALNGLRPQYRPITGANFQAQNCQSACDVLAAAAGAACVVETDGLAIAFCRAAIEAARQYCHNACGQ